MSPGAIAPGLLSAITIALAGSFLAREHGGPQLLYALFFGIAFNFAAASPQIRPGIDFASKKVLRIGVALLGARITFGQIAELGAGTLAIVVVAVVATIAFGVLLARLMGRPMAQGLLGGGAVAICGASAALALAAVLPKNETQHRFTLLAVVGVTTLSTIAMVAYPLLAGVLGLSPEATAIFLGGSIHDVAQVVGAGFTVSPRVGEGATLVKLMRVAMLVPVVLAVTWLFRNTPGSEDGARPPLLPGFLIGFVALVVLNSLGYVPAAVGAALAGASRWCLVIAIAALGVRTSFADLARLGWQPVAMLIAETVFIGALVLAGTAFLH
ncbi:MAG: hypothetical protein RIS35_2315 [Pseudomonadota bacterium]|jgi:uncharacterized integral membrane protein (TIGR00698 family)